MPKNNVLTIMVIVAIAIIIVVTYQNRTCPLVFDKTLQVSDVTALLLKYGIIAILIERFTNQFVLVKESEAYSEALKGMFPVSLNSMTYQDKKSIAVVYKPKFYWLSFFLGMLIASIGFRFFTQLLDPILVGCPNQNTFFVYLDVVLTGLLLSGGSALIMEVAKAMKSR